MTDQTNGEAKFVCTARTVESYPLVIASRYNIPFLLGKPGAGYVCKSVFIILFS